MHIKKIRKNKHFLNVFYIKIANFSQNNYKQNRNLFINMFNQIKNF